MSGRAHHTHGVSGPADVGALRRVVSALAGDAGFTNEETGRAAIVATEIGTNLVKHASDGGEVLIRCIGPTGDRTGYGVEIIALDRGDGIRNTAQAILDGVSSRGTQGAGLGAIRRLSHDFDIYSRPGHGTALLSRLWARSRSPYQASIRPPVQARFGAVMRAKPGEEACGDLWYVEQRLSRIRILVVDGLGHGPLAAEASQRASEIFVRCGGLSPAGTRRCGSGTLQVADSL